MVSATTLTTNSQLLHFTRNFRRLLTSVEDYMELHFVFRQHKNKHTYDTRNTKKKSERKRVYNSYSRPITPAI